MPSKVVQANTTAQQVAARRENASHYVRSLTIDNDGGLAKRTIRIQDIFTPSASNGVASPTEQTVDRWRGTTLMGGVDNYGKEDLKGVKCLGALKVIADAVDTGCYITVGYETK